jgi:hypothetical protein
MVPRETRSFKFALIQTGPVAQLVEQGTFNPKVAGSNPARPICARRRRLGDRGSGIAVLRGWRFFPELLFGRVGHAPLEDFTRLTRDIHIPGGETRFGRTRFAIRALSSSPPRATGSRRGSGSRSRSSTGTTRAAGARSAASPSSRATTAPGSPRSDGTGTSIAPTRADRAHSSPVSRRIASVGMVR